MGSATGGFIEDDALPVAAVEKVLGVEEHLLSGWNVNSEPVFSQIGRATGAVPQVDYSPARSRTPLPVNQAR